MLANATKSSFLLKIMTISRNEKHYRPFRIFSLSQGQPIRNQTSGPDNRACTCRFAGILRNWQGMQYILAFKSALARTKK
jgi:hypothetical protein